MRQKKREREEENREIEKGKGKRGEREKEFKRLCENSLGYMRRQVGKYIIT